MAKLPMLRPALAVFSTNIAGQAPKHTNPFYLTPEWRELVAHLIKVRGRKCENCGSENCRVLADHIKEIQDGGALLDENNIQLLCWKCHGIKTAKARLLRHSSLSPPG